jgi:hypothetical protein
MSGQGVPSVLPHRIYRGSVPLYDEVHLLLQHMVELYAGRGIPVQRLGESLKRFAAWLLDRKRVFNRRSTLRQEDIEEETRTLFSSGAAARVLGNEKLSGFLRSVVLDRRVLDYTTLSLSAASSS